MSEPLRTIQMAQLDLAVEVNRICEAHNIRYFLVAGTALGAIRHHGFIPWDDDLDIGMFRKDFERFKEVCKTDLDPAYFYQDYDTDPYYGLAFAKLRIRGTHYVEEKSMQSKCMDGVFIDIFPFDKTAETVGKEKKAAKQFYFLFRVLLAKQGYQPSGESALKKIVYKGLRAIPVSKQKVIQKLWNVMTMYESGSSPNIITYGGSYGYWKERMDKSIFEDAEMIDFEGCQFPVPKHWQEYLTILYGNYMQMPPENERGSRHKIVNADLGGYRIRNEKGGSSGCQSLTGQH